ncbi:MAG: protein kinase [Acidobacteriia bacterium]|nr:protein kinase [Terriglobia bacterium]
MTPEQWETLQGFFEEVIQKPLEERPEVLSRLESEIQDPAIRMELRRLVEHAEVGAEFLRPVAGLGLFPDRPALQQGDLIADRFKILRPIGKGGMAEVFEAYDSKLGERVAIKIIAPEFARDPSLLERFQQEVQIARRITHPNICRIHDLGEHHGLPYLSMEFLEGETLSKVLERGPLPLELWNDLAHQLLQGLRAAHAAGVVHRDLKPSNLILTGSRLVILDFGLARPILTSEDGGLTRPGTLVGTLDWMAPEQLLEEYDERSDLYSAALILVRALKQGSDTTGIGGLAGAVRRATTDTEFRAQIPKSLPAPWRYALLSCLERDPKQRPRSVEEVQKLVQAQHVLPLQLRHFAGSNWRSVAIVLVVLALFLASLRTLWYSRQKQPEGLKPGSVIMIAFADNTTQDSRFDGLTAVLREDFGQSARFNVWDQRRFREVARAMRRDPTVRPEGKQWREIAVREGVPLLVYSTLSRVGDSYVFSVRCEQIGASPETAFQKWDDTETASGPQDVFEAIHRATMHVRELAGENAAEISANNRLLQDITSSSWEAIGLYSEAQRSYAQGHADDAVSSLRRAVDRDPQFAMGFMRLGDILDSQNKVKEGLENWQKAIELARAQHLSEHERLNIESRYALEIKDFSKAEPVLRDWIGKFPNDPIPVQLLAWCLMQMGRYTEGVRFAQEAQDRFPHTEFGTTVLIRGLAALNELGDAVDKQLTILDIIARKPLAQEFHGTVAALRGNYPAAAGFFREVMLSDDTTEASRATAQLANLEADQGKIDEARKLLRDGILKDQQTGNAGFASQKAVALAYLEGIRGNHTEAIALAADAGSMSQYPWVIVQAVSILARYGSLEKANRLMNRFPAGVGPRYDADLFRMRGEILAAKRNYKQAIDLFEKASNLDRPQQPKEYLARVMDLAGDHGGARLKYQQIVATSFLTWITDDEWPATRFLARENLKNSRGE